MKFEEVLPDLREGKHVTNGFMKGNYYQAGYMTITFDESYKELTIFKCNFVGKVITDIHSWGMPLHEILRDDWEIVE